MDSRNVAGLLLLTATTACGARTDLPSDANDGTASSSSGSPSCTLTIDEGSTVSALIAEGERVYYVENHGRVMAVDADTGEGKVLAQVPIQGLNVTHGLALDADWLYVTFIAPGIGFPALWQIPKAGGEPKLIASGRINNVFIDETGLYWTNWLSLQAKHAVFRRRPDGTKLLLGMIDETYDDLPGIFRGTAGLLVSSGTALLAFDIEGAGATTLLDVKRISYPFERDGALFYNVGPCSPYDLDPCTPHGFYRALPDGTMAQRLYTGPFERVTTLGLHLADRLRCSRFRRVLSRRRVVVRVSQPDLHFAPRGGAHADSSRARDRVVGDWSGLSKHLSRRDRAMSRPSRPT